MPSRCGRRTLLAGSLLLVLTVLVAAALGAVPVPVADVLRILVSRLAGLPAAAGAETHETIIWAIRLPRVLLALLAGISLAGAGAAFQGLFKNPMADPYVVGVSAGAALGASLTLTFLAHFQVRVLGPVPAAAFAGGLAATFLVYRLARVGSRIPIMALLLSGVAVSSMGFSLVSLVLYLASREARDGILFWLMGSLAGASWEKVGWVFPYTVAGLGALLHHSRELNALLLGEDQAGFLGVEVERVKRAILLAGTLLTAAAVSFSGTIGFVGLVVPHLVRLLVGPDHRYLIPTAAVFGGALLVTADTLARTALSPRELPVGLVMSVLGGPFFLYLLRRHLRRPGR